MIEQIWHSYFSEHAFLVFISCLRFAVYAEYLKGVDFVKNFNKEVYLNSLKIKTPNKKYFQRLYVAVFTLWLHLPEKNIQKIIQYLYP